MIEKFDVMCNKWVILDFKLWTGIEAGLIYPTDCPNEILMIG
jgi:hypothetical protein